MSPLNYFERLCCALCSLRGGLHGLFCGPITSCSGSLNGPILQAPIRALLHILSPTTLILAIQQARFVGVELVVLSEVSLPPECLCKELCLLLSPEDNATLVDFEALELYDDTARTWP